MDATQRVVVLANEPIGVINPLLHAQFAEHLGELVYHGLWVGPDSPIANIDGLRRDVIEALRPLHLPLLRWPGGNFADSYRWDDGVGPRQRRPRRVNVQWGNAPEPNHFGTHEFMHLCRLLDAQPYFGANLGSQGPGVMRDWVEYCNWPGSSELADQRRDNGSAEPFNVRYWGIGNETWGCGGSMGPEHYAAEFCRYRTFLHRYGDTEPFAIAAGPNQCDWQWTRRFFHYLRHNHWDRTPLAQGFGAHYYTWNNHGRHGTATAFTPMQWLELLSKAACIEGAIVGHRAIMDDVDPQRKIQLIFDEWGSWHPTAEGKPAWGLYQQNSLRDAAVAAVTLNIFNLHADKLYMANLAQVVNVLHSLILTHEDRCLRTPTWHVFDLFQAHRNGQSLRCCNESEPVSDGGSAAEECRNAWLDHRDFRLPALHASASLRDEALCVTLVNCHPTRALQAVVDIRGLDAPAMEAITLGSGDITAHNTFDQPDALVPTAPRMIEPKDNCLRLTLPPGAVARLRSLPRRGQTPA